MLLTSKVVIRVLLFVAISVLPFLSIVTSANAADSKSIAKQATGGAPANAESSSTVLPDLFTGTMSYQIPIEVPPGRNGMEPAIALTYRSSNGNGWLGVGWELELGSIQRSFKNGVNYGADDFQFKTGSFTADLVNVGNDEYLAKIESQFSRIKKLPSADGQTYWEVTDKKGTKFTFGQSSATRQNNTDNASKIFKWCLERIEDTNGNIITVSYTKGQTVSDKNEIYLDQLDYNGNQIKFYLENRSDKPTSYSSGFGIQTAKRLKTIYVQSPTGVAHTYKLSYTDSNSTSRSILSSVQHFGKDAVVNSAGDIVNSTLISSTPLQSFSTTNQFNTMQEQPWTSTSFNWGDAGYTWVGDFNGDGRMDIATSKNGTIWVNESKIDANGNSYFEEGDPWVINSPNWGNPSFTWVGDFDGDGRDDIATANNYKIWVKLSKVDANGKNIFDEKEWASNQTDWGEPGYSRIGDFNGDGRMDIATIGNGTIWVKVSKVDANGNGYFESQTWSASSTGWGNPSYTWFGDFNGDGRTDIATANDYQIWVKLSKFDAATGKDTFESQRWALNQTNWGDPGYTWIGDFNGDGRMDIATSKNGTIWVKVSKVDASGNGCFEEEQWATSTPNWGIPGYTWVGDFNGDGLTDIATSSSGTIWMKRSTGTSFVEELLASNTPNWGISNYTRVGDFDGDGKTDIATARDSAYIWVKKSSSFPTDLVTSISNGIGKTDTIQYTPSTKFQNTNLPFPVQVVTRIDQSIAGVSKVIASINYEGGYFYKPGRDFRGFSHVTTKGAVGPNGEQLVTDSKFHQGNDTAIDSNNPKVKDGYMKGKIYRTWTSDVFGNKFSETTTSYVTDSESPFFNPPLQVDNYLYDGDTTPKHTSTAYFYDDYGNVRREEFHGETTADDRTVVRTFSPNLSKWLVAQPATEDVYQGIGTSTKIAGKTYYYDDLSDCDSTPTYNQTPVYGKLTRVVSYLEGGTSPETRIAYDDYGNPLCKRDARGNTTKIRYDSSNTFPLTVTNPLGHQSVTQYYGVYNGVNIVAADNGLYGQVKSSTDPNGATVTYQYDVFGRKTLESLPDGTWTSMAYNNFGTIGSQHVRSATSAGLWQENYFDGLGRTIKTRASGPDSKVIVTTTTYNSTGTVQQNSLPYFEGIDTPRYQSYTYDPAGRVLTATNADATINRACYKGGATVNIDANGHRRREVRNALGRLVTVQEYTGSYNTCLTDENVLATDNVVHVPYSTTSYQYDIPGNLRFLTDTKGNQTEMRYDTLGRKRYMKDPDMGEWWYDTYDANGNLETQIDAKGQDIYFTYDELNRLKTKKHGASLVLTNYYDEVVSGYAHKGRLTRMVDNTGQSNYYYDNMGRIVYSGKTITGAASKLLSYGYTQGRLSSITYPDGEKVSYGYNGPVLASAGTYASFNGYNAFGQPGTINYLNDVKTQYVYKPETGRLWVNLTTRGSSYLLNLMHSYDNIGNISGIGNALDTTRSQSFYYDEQNRLIQAVNSVYGTRNYSYDQIGNIRTKEGVVYDYTSSRPHAVTTLNGVATYGYDDNGNLETDSLRGITITYDYDNMPLTIGSVSFNYDGNGTRVKKSSPAGSTLYYDKLYECSATNVCTKYIFAGNTRIASNTNGVKNFFHPDHLGSTALVTDIFGAKVEDLAYYPFGTSRIDSNEAKDSHKFTDQEKDSETGLYNYNARLYNSDLGRFLTPDSIIPDPTNPQSLNRYSYVQNNPLNYTDPSGHFLETLGYMIGVAVVSYLVDEYNGDGHTTTTVSAGNEGVKIDVSNSNSRSNASSSGSSGQGSSGGNWYWYDGGDTAYVKLSIGIYDYNAASYDALPFDSAGEKSDKEWFSGAKSYYNKRAQEQFAAGNYLAGAVDKAGVIAMQLLPRSFSDVPLLMVGGTEIRGAGKAVQTLKSSVMNVNPRNLLSTQTRSEMSGSQINRLIKDMKINGYDLTKPVTAVRNAFGRLEIQDGHHRTEAAIRAGINSIPVRILE